jgi:hypothetical protein
MYTSEKNIQSKVSQISNFARAHLMFWVAKSKYLSSISKPIKFRLVLTQATPVDPTPMQLSKTVSPGFE